MIKIPDLQTILYRNFDDYSVIISGSRGKALEPLNGLYKLDVVVLDAKKYWDVVKFINIFWEKLELSSPVHRLYPNRLKVLYDYNSFDTGYIITLIADDIWERYALYIWNGYSSEYFLEYFEDGTDDLERDINILVKTMEVFNES